MNRYGTVAIRMSIRKLLDEYFQETRILLPHPESVTAPREMRCSSFLSHAVKFIRMDMVSFERRLDELVTLRNNEKIAKKPGDMFRGTVSCSMDDESVKGLDELIRFVSDKLGTSLSANRTRTIEWAISYCIVTKRDEFTIWLREQIEDLAEVKGIEDVLIVPRFDNEEDRQMYELERSLMMPIKWKPVTAFIVNENIRN